MPDHFGQNKDWLRALGREAVAPGSVLCQIEIEYTPTVQFYFYADAMYTWNRVDALVREFQPVGITLHYSSPSITRQEFVDYSCLYEGLESAVI